MFGSSRRVMVNRRSIMARCLEWIGTIALCFSPLSAASDEGLLSHPDYSAGEQAIAELLGETVSADELEANLQSALEAARETGDTAALSKQLDLIVRNADLLPPQDVFEEFTDALLTCGRAEELALRTPRLLKYAETEFNPSATAKLNLGVKLALTFGGAAFDDLRRLIGIRGVDLDWLLPALGKTGREKATPLIESYSVNRSLERAVALGLAYAGDTNALQKLLVIQERDMSSLERSGGSVLYHLLMGEQRQAERARTAAAECRRRIEQVERFLDSLGDSVLPLLIDQAVRDGSPVAMQYLFRKMGSIPVDRLSGLLGLLEHPEPFTRQLVVQRLWDAGDPELRDEILGHLRRMATAPAGYDRLTAIALLCRIAPEEGFDRLQRALARESNAAVRIALENLQQAKNEE